MSDDRLEEQGRLSCMILSLSSLFHGKRRRGFFIGLASFLAGLGAGVLLEQWRLWRDQQGYFNELLRQVAILQTEVKQLRQQQRTRRQVVDRRMDATDSQQMPSEVGASLACSTAYYSTRDFLEEVDDDDLFVQARSEMDLESLYSFHTVLESTGAPNSTGDAEQVTALFAELDRLLDSDAASRSEAYERCLALRNSPQLRVNPDFQWRLAKCCHFESNSLRELGYKDEAQRLAFVAAEASEKALELQENSAPAHKWRAITVGILGDYQSTQQKILNGYKFKEHIDRAIELNPLDYAAHYLRGRWCWGVYSLSWLEKRAAAALFASPPSSTVEEALDCFLQVEQLHPRQWIENLVYAAKCHLELRQTDEATELMLAAVQLPVRNSEDEAAAKEVAELLRRCNVELPVSTCS